MDDLKKALWVALPLFVAAGVTLIPGPENEVRAVAYALLTLIAMAGIWATNARKHRLEREEKERKREEDREATEQQRWDALNVRLDNIDKRLDIGEKSDRAMLRSNLVKAHREWVEEKGYITLEALEVTEKTYQAYKAVKGNHTGDKMWEDICNLPIDERR